MPRYKPRKWQQRETFKLAAVKVLKNETQYLSLLLIGYWETLQHQLKAHIARARLREFHQTMLRKKLEELKKQVK